MNFFDPFNRNRYVGASKNPNRFRRRFWHSPNFKSNLGGGLFLAGCLALFLGFCYFVAVAADQSDGSNCWGRRVHGTVNGQQTDLCIESGWISH